MNANMNQVDCLESEIGHFRLVSFVTRQMAKSIPWSMSRYLGVGLTDYACTKMTFSVQNEFRLFFLSQWLLNAYTSIGWDYPN